MSRAERDFIRSAELGTAVIAEPVVPPAAPLSHRRRWRAAVPNQLFGRLGAASPHLKGWLWRCWYDLLAGRYPQADWTFMNYGFAPTEPTAVLSLARADEANRYPIQLYQHVLRGVDLRGARVLEVGCGRGGGCSYMARYLEPASVLGVDVSARAVAFCRRVHSVAGLTFQQGDAGALPCPAGAFDLVVNVESSHCYGSLPTFLGEVFRVLRPGGYLLWADLRAVERLEETRRQFAAAGFRCRADSLITANVIRALDLISEQKREMIRRLVPRLLAPCVEDFAGVRGTRVYESLRAGAVEYSSVVLQKSGSLPPHRAGPSQGDMQDDHRAASGSPAAGGGAALGF